jgi:hypothetical protein
VEEKLETNEEFFKDLMFERISRLEKIGLKLQNILEDTTNKIEKSSGEKNESV